MKDDSNIVVKEYEAFSALSDEEQRKRYRDYPAMVVSDGLSLTSIPHPWSYERNSFTELAYALSNVRVEENGYQTVHHWVTHYGLQKARVFFIGNGGSAAIASHMAIDFMKNGGFATFGPGDGAHFTCLSNDWGFDNVYSVPISRHGAIGDVLFAISSSGMSEDILKAVDVAKEKRMNVVTLSGFGEGNFLRSRGGVNFYVPSNEYGTVEIAHLAIIHSILDEVIAKDKA